MHSCKGINEENETNTEAQRTDEKGHRELFLSPASQSVREYQSEPADFHKHDEDKLADREILSSSPLRRTGLNAFRLDIPNSIISGSSKTISTGVKKQFPDGSCYIGACNSKGVPHGGGQFVGIGGDMFEGEFSNGRLEGRGTLTDVRGSRYVGTFKDSLRHGKGVEKMASGDVYEGEFFNDKRSGYGKVILI